MCACVCVNVYICVFYKTSPVPTLKLTNFSIFNFQERLQLNFCVFLCRQLMYAFYKISPALTLKLTNFSIFFFQWCLELNFCVFLCGQPKYVCFTTSVLHSLWNWQIFLSETFRKKFCLFMRVTMQTKFYLSQVKINMQQQPHKQVIYK